MTKYHKKLIVGRKRRRHSRRPQSSIIQLVLLLPFSREEAVQNAIKAA